MLGRVRPYDGLFSLLKDYVRPIALRNELFFNPLQFPL